MVLKSHIRDVLNAGKKAPGCWFCLGDAATARVMASTVDWVLVDAGAC